MAKTISQRITLEGSEDIRKKLQELGKAGEAAFKQIQDAAAKPIADPQQMARSRQAVDQLVVAGQRLSEQFQALTGDARQFGQAGAQAGQQAATGLNQANVAAQQVGASVQMSATKFGILAGAVAGATQAVTSKLLSVAGQLQQAFSPKALLKGAVESANVISDQADKVGVTTEKWAELRREIAGSSTSVEDFVKSADKVGAALTAAGTGAIKIGETTVTLSKFGDNVVKIFGGKGEVNQGLSKFVDELTKAGVPLNNLLDALAKGDKLAVMTEIAKAISLMTDETKKAAVGAKFLGDNWKGVVEVLVGSKDGINDLVEAQKAARKAARDMSADMVTLGKEVKGAWDDVDLAFRALQDRIGTLFFSGSKVKAEWLSALIDGTRELLDKWLKLADAKREAFLEGLGDSPAEFLFKTLIALSQQLSNLWNQVLVPAGQALKNVFSQISGQFEGVKTSQVAAFFVTAAIAATGLALALKAMGLVLGPLLALFSPFGAILLVAGAAAARFWTVLAAGAQRVAALIPNSLALIQTAIRNLFAGNFAKAWAQFAEGATAAFGTLTQAAVRAQGPIGSIARGMQQIAKDFPAAVKLIVAALIGLGVAATGLADTINSIFGTKLTGTDIALIAIVLQLTGLFTTLASIATIAGTAIGVLIGIFGGLATAITLGAAALITYMGWWPQVSAAVVTAINIMKPAWDGFVLAFQNGLVILTPVWSGFVTAFQNGLAILKPVWDGFVAAFVNGLVIIGNAAVAAWPVVKAGFEALIPVINAVWEALKIGGSIIGEVASNFLAGLDIIIGGIQNVIGWLKEAWEWTKKVFSGSPEVGGSVGGFASGGYVNGPGSATSDSILARLSNGEFVMSAKAVKHFGAGFFAALNSLRRPPGFAAGGLLGPRPQVAMPRFAEGGMAGRDLGTLTLAFGGQSVQVMAAPSAVEQLTRFATISGQRRAGRRPGWA